MIVSKLDIDLAVRSFRATLAASWPHISKLAEKDKTESFLIDWMQANWEMIVEASIPPELKVVLEFYGEGADCNGRSSRVWMPLAEENYQVVCVPKGGREIINAISGEKITGKMVLEEFCTLSDGWISISPPFDYVNIQRSDPCLVDIDLVEFEIQPLHS